MKKLKLIGEPYKVLRNTAFVKGMFTSKLQVAKYIGAQIRTVSGIRGQIKKEAGDDGTFRATFQDKILKSDIVFCRTWYSVEVPRFYNPAISYGKVRYLKSTAELRRERDLEIPVKRDSNYEEIKRDPKRLFQQLVVPDKLERVLPYKTKQKVKMFVDQDKIALRRKLEKQGLPAKAPFKLMMSENERKVLAMVERLSALQRQRKQEKKEAKQQRALKMEKKASRQEAKRAQVLRGKKKAKFRGIKKKGGKQTD